MRVQTGDISATLDGMTLRGPLMFEEAVVSETATRPLREGYDLDDELVAFYQENYETWVAQSRAARGDAPQKSFSAPIHTPCPALWAGR